MRLSAPALPRKQEGTHADVTSKELRNCGGGHKNDQYWEIMRFPVTPTKCPHLQMGAGCLSSASAGGLVLRVNFPSILPALFFALWVRSRLGQLSEIIVLRPQATTRTVPGTQGHRITLHESVSWEKASLPKAAVAKNLGLEDCASSSLSSLLLGA